MTNLEPTAHRRKAKPILISIVTYLLEGRIHLLQRVDVIGRLEYVVIANMVIGTVLAIWLLRYYHISWSFISTKQLGFQSVNRRFWAVVGIASMIGFVLFVIQGPVNYLSSKGNSLVNKGNKGIESTDWRNNHRINITNRRTTVWDYISKGTLISEIAANLDVDKSTISKDIKFLVRDSQKYLDDVARQTLPFMHRQSIEGKQQILLVLD